MESVEEKKPKNDEEKPKFVARTPTDIQRIKLERLMKNPVCICDEYSSKQTIVAFRIVIFIGSKKKWSFLHHHRGKMVAMVLAIHRHLFEM